MHFIAFHVCQEPIDVGVNSKGENSKGIWKLDENSMRYNVCLKWLLVSSKHTIQAKKFGSIAKHGFYTLVVELKRYG